MTLRPGGSVVLFRREGERCRACLHSAGEFGEEGELAHAKKLTAAREDGLDVKLLVQQQNVRIRALAEHALLRQRQRRGGVFCLAAKSFSM